MPVSENEWEYASLRGRGGREGGEDGDGRGPVTCSVASQTSASTGPRPDRLIAPRAGVRGRSGKEIALRAAATATDC